MPRLQAWNSLVETPVRRRAAARRAGARRPGSAAPSTTAPPGRRRRARAAAPPRRDRRARPRPRRRARARARSSSSAASPGSASRRSSSRRRPASRGLVGPERVLYATGEESAAQVRLRAERLGAPRRHRPAAIRVARRIVDRPDRGRGDDGGQPPALLVVDSIQTATVDELDGPAGSVGQVRGSALRLMELAKPDGIAVVLVGHVTKDGSIAGPKTLEHLVDAVLTLDGERYADASASCARRRTGSARPRRSACSRWARPACAEVADPARAFLAEHDGPAPGQRRRADPGGIAAAARRGPGARRAGPRRHAAADDERRRRQPGVAPRRGPRATGRDRPGEPRRLRQPRRRPGRRRAGPRPAARAGPRVVAPRPPDRGGHRRDRRGRPARRAALGGRARAPAARGRAARVRAGRSSRAGRAVPATPDVPGLEIVAVGSLREAIEAALSPAVRSAPAAWRRPRRDAKATAAAARPHGRWPRPPREGRREGTRDPQHPPARGRAGRPRRARSRRGGPALRAVADGRLAAGRVGRRLDRRRLRDPAVPHRRPGRLADPPGRSSSRPPSSSPPSSACSSAC